MPFDAIIVGGGLGGAALGKALAEHGVRVLILEREKSFRDRLRGEALLPWGVTEARTLGIYEHLLHTCGHELRWIGPPQGGKRDMLATTPNHSGALSFYHPSMQSAMLDQAEEVGAEVWRGAHAIDVTPGRPAGVTVRFNEREELLRAGLVIGADGRGSLVRARSGFSVRRDPDRLLIAVALYQGLPLPEDTIQIIEHSKIGHVVVIVPIGQQRFRIYLMHPMLGAERRLSGRARSPAFIEACVVTGAMAAWFEGAELASPLGEFECADTWVDHPYCNGVVLIGDAAAASDPSWAQGLSLTLRDVRVLRDQLLTTEDWEIAANAYATTHGIYYGNLHRIEGWKAELTYDVGPQADARRARASAYHEANPGSDIDMLALGPDAPSDEAARRRYFGEEGQ